jgi:hypothetical protein
MTVVLVHGNPETDAIWGPLVDALGRTDVVRLSPPGFGSPLPDDFPVTYVAYRDWLEGELEDIGDDRAFRFWPPRTLTSAPTRSGVERPNGPAPTRRCSTGSGTGG